ncbi:hypothetical protein [Pseudomonas putida]|uniref:hypothetical protein n=1 Tax=Pseudomonas putida TaxID=303 RepID=UPI00235C2EB3|nr:hypothetical protein [Pseudomonas putida]GLO25400.1 hypothetical protein PPUJ21368_32290 [Pseudomonas putida]HDS0968644.1 hypothetical protein [Pseudomonas putida]
MEWSEFGVVIPYILTFIVGGVCSLVWRNYLPSYMGEKGKNLATKEDIEVITSKIESVKVEYSKQFEDYKGQQWRSQQRFLWLQEESKLKIDTFKRAVVDVARLIDVIKKYQHFISERELALACAGVSKAESDEDSRQLYIRKHKEFDERTTSAFSEYRNLVVEVGSLYALLAVYFDDEISRCLTDVLGLAHLAVRQKMTFEEISDLLVTEYKAVRQLDHARVKVGEHYDKLCDVGALSLAAQHFYNLLKSHVNSLAGRLEETETR